jgi:putative pyruvate formate lyase activating enzyme
VVSFSFYDSCTLCPRRCGVDRNARYGGGAEVSRQVFGYCGESAALRLVCASVHRGEEPPLTGGAGGGGSGAIFVSGCNLGCVFCQNRQISRPRRGGGRPVLPAEFAVICLALQERGAENINIVTGSHAVPAIAEGLRAAKTGIAGVRLTLPVAWNSSAYELPETLELLDGLVDIFLPDFKTLDGALAARYFNAPDYPETAAAAIKKMMEIAGRGPPPGTAPAVIVRHLVLPGHLESTREVLRWFAANCAGRRGILLSLMFQYTPAGTGPNRCISEAEYDTVLGWLSGFGIEEGFCQELAPEAGRLPDFDRGNPFPPELAATVWHWREGFVQ